MRLSGRSISLSKLRVLAMQLAQHGTLMGGSGSLLLKMVSRSAPFQIFGN